MEIFPFTPALIENSDVFFRGLRTTLLLLAGGLAGALAIGVVMASMRTWGGPLLRDLGGIYVEFFRNTPLLVQLLFLQTLLAPAYLGVTRQPEVAAMIALAVYTGSYVTEAIRSGILSVDPRQIEAARSIGLTQLQSIRHVVLPQAIRTVIPPLGSIAIALTKNTAVAAAVAAPELLRAAQTIENRTSRFDGFFAALLAYWVITLSLAFVISRLERRLAFAR